MEYKTLKQRASAEFTEQRSRFICNLSPVKTEQQAIEFIESQKQKYWDAKHNVYAYILKDGNIKRYSDDGEPHSTAGLPVLETMSKNGLFDCVLVVTRYFGGILLGTGGLVRAYGNSAKLGIEASGVCVMKQSFTCSLKVPYNDYGKLERILQNETVKIKSTDFTDTVTVTFSIPSADFEKFNAKITEAFFGAAVPKKEYEGYEDFEI